jgi:hypothetical protein
VTVRAVNCRHKPSPDTAKKSTAIDELRRPCRGVDPLIIGQEREGRRHERAMDLVLDLSVPKRAARRTVHDEVDGGVRVQAADRGDPSEQPGHTDGRRAPDPDQNVGFVDDRPRHRDA